MMLLNIKVLKEPKRLTSFSQNLWMGTVKLKKSLPLKTNFGY